MPVRPGMAVASLASGRWQGERQRQRTCARAELKAGEVHHQAPDLLLLDGRLALLLRWRLCGWADAGHPTHAPPRRPPAVGRVPVCCICYV